MSNYLIQSETLSDIANAIRNKTGKTNAIKVKDMAYDINTIEGVPNQSSLLTSSMTCSINSDNLDKKHFYIENKGILYIYDNNMKFYTFDGTGEIIIEYPEVTSEATVYTYDLYQNHQDGNIYTIAYGDNDYASFFKLNLSNSSYNYETLYIDLIPCLYGEQYSRQWYIDDYVVLGIYGHSNNTSTIAMYNRLTNEKDFESLDIINFTYSNAWLEGAWRDGSEATHTYYLQVDNKIIEIALYFTYTADNSYEILNNSELTYVQNFEINGDIAFVLEKDRRVVDESYEDYISKYIEYQHRYCLDTSNKKFTYLNNTTEEDLYKFSKALKIKQYLNKIPCLCLNNEIIFDLNTSSWKEIGIGLDWQALRIKELGMSTNYSSSFNQTESLEVGGTRHAFVSANLWLSPNAAWDSGTSTPAFIFNQKYNVVYYFYYTGFTCYGSTDVLSYTELEDMLAYSKAKCVIYSIDGTTLPSQSINLCLLNNSN